MEATNIGVYWGSLIFTRTKGYWVDFVFPAFFVTSHTYPNLRFKSK